MHWLKVLLICSATLPLIIPKVVLANIYRCTNGDKVVFSQSTCPKEFRQHEIQYQLGITKEFDTDRKQQTQDPLQALLSKNTISQENLLKLIDSEIYRLNQENSYYEILRTSQKQKIERKRYWQKKELDDPLYLTELAEMNEHYDELKAANNITIKQLEEHRKNISLSSTVYSTPDEPNRYY